MSLNARFNLKCALRTLDVRLLRVSDSTVRIGVARGERGSGLEGLAPPCGQLTRCFSAVAELLVSKSDNLQLCINQPQ